MKLCSKGLHDLDDQANVYVAPRTGKSRCGPCLRLSRRLHARRSRKAARERKAGS